MRRWTWAPGFAFEPSGWLGSTGVPAHLRWRRLFLASTDTLVSLRDHWTTKKTSVPPQAPPSRPPARSRPSVDDVASLAGVSLGTVSNVLNHPTKVAAATRKRVERAIVMLGYVP